MELNTITIIFICIAAACIICILLLILANRGLNREVNSMVRAYQDLKNEVEESTRSNQTTVQTVQNTLKTFGDMIAINQRNASDSANKRLDDMGKRISDMALQNDQRLENVRQTTLEQIARLTDENSKQLEKMRETVDEKLQKTLEDRISKSFENVSSQLEQVYKGLGEMQTLAVGVGDLKKVLSNVKTRGILGEVQLGAILNQILAPEQYEENVATVPGSPNRVEFAVRLPGDGESVIYLPIDSKFPGERYAALRDAYESGNKAEIDAAWRQLETVIKEEAKDIRDKYVSVPYTTDFGIMFLPFEGLYSEVVNHGMLETLQRDYKINIAGPATMAALLNSLQMGFRTLAIQKHSDEVWKLLGAVKTEFATFETVLDKIRRNMQKADEDLEKLVGTRSRAISRKLRSVEMLDMADAKNLLELDDMITVPESSEDQ